MELKGFEANEHYGVLRPLRPSDADGMLEWMHDPAVASAFQVPFETFSREDALRFIEGAQKGGASVHLAITEPATDEYLGTISLKNVDADAGTAEYAIATRTCAHGSGIAKTATIDVLRYAFEVLGLNRVYLNVLGTNGRAIHFYEKIGFIHEGTFRKHVRHEGQLADLEWFAMLSADFRERESCAAAADSRPHPHDERDDSRPQPQDEPDAHRQTPKA